MITLDLISDFNVDVLARYLATVEGLPALSITPTCFGQLFQSLQAPGEGAVGMIWARPEGVSAKYSALQEGESAELSAVLSEVEQFAQLICSYAETKTRVLVASFVPSRNERGLGILDWSAEGPSYVRAKMNVRLADTFRGVTNVHLIDASRWLESVSPSRSAKHWFALKSPFTEKVFRAAARDIKAALRAGLGQSRKLVILDLDDTLWGGVVGEVGWEGLRLGGHDHLGEAFVDFQKALQTLTRRGIQVALISKNDESVALEAVDNHPAMVLRRSDLAGWRINWFDKATNIIDLVSELNLGLQSVVFLDDNPAERGRVREVLPEVMVPDWPTDPTLFGDTLRQLDCFDQATISEEDRKRTAMYVVERERRNNIASFTSIDDWLLSSEITVQVAELDDSNLKRAVQLLNKTNQFNLRSRRLTENEMLVWVAARETRRVTTVSVGDRFGELGLTGLISWERSEDSLVVVDYLLSCRAMGRRIELFMLHLAVEAARATGLTLVVASLVPTERNGPCLEFWRNQSGFSETEANVFVWDAAQAYETPPAIRWNK